MKKIPVISSTFSKIEILNPSKMYHILTISINVLLSVSRLFADANISMYLVGLLSSISDLLLYKHSYFNIDIS
jgi:hypothetical protein